MLGACPEGGAGMSTESRRTVEPEREMPSPANVFSPKEVKSGAASRSSGRTHSSRASRSSRSSGGSHSSQSQSAGQSSQSANYSSLSRNGAIGEENVKPINATEFIMELYRAVKRLYLLPIVLSVIFAVGFCYYARVTFNPIYRSNATFTVSVNNVSNRSSQAYSSATAQQLSLTFPYIFQSGVLSNLIMKDIGLTDLPASISLTAVGDTNLFTLSVISRTPQMSYTILESAINNYPKVAEYVVGNTDIELLSAPSMPSTPVNSISYKDQIVSGVLWGCGAALVFIVVMTLTKTTVRNPNDLKTMLNLRCVGNVPYVSRRKRSGEERKMLSLANEDVSKNFADSMRLIRSRTEKTLDENKYRVLLVASSMPGEGKTTVSTNLAMSLAMSGRSVALIDCDIRKPSSMGELTTQKESGIVEYLNGLVPLDDIINTPVENLIVINGKTPSDEAAELLGTDKMRGLVDELLQRVEFVILDSPPAAVIADAVVLAGIADCILYVIRQEFTRKSRILDGLNNLARGNAVFLGYVLNSASSSGSGYGYGSYSRYSRDSR